MGLILVLAGVACNDDDDDDNSLPVPFECSGGGPASPDTVYLTCSASGTSLVGIDVFIGGPTSSADIYAIYFDLVFDEGVIRFESPAIEGTFLNKDSEPTNLQAAVDSGDAGRLVVAIARLGDVGGVSATVASERVMTLFFSGVAPGDTSLGLENTRVVDSNLMTIGSIQFGSPATAWIH